MDEKIATFSSIQHTDLVLEKLYEELEDDIRRSKNSIVSSRYSKNIQEYKTMAAIAIGTLAVTHSIVSNP